MPRQHNGRHYPTVADLIEMLGKMPQDALLVLPLSRAAGTPLPASKLMVGVDWPTRYVRPGEPGYDERLRNECIDPEQPAQVTVTFGSV